MILHRRKHSRLLSIGLLCLVIGLAWPDFAYGGAHFGAELNHFLRGLAMGLSITIILGSVVGWRGRSACRKPAATESARVPLP
jgi:type VI protein secretion system component VasK